MDQYNMHCCFRFAEPSSPDKPAEQVLLTGRTSLINKSEEREMAGF